MTIRVDITHFNNGKQLDGAELIHETLFIDAGQGVQKLEPGEGGTFYVHRQQDIRMFYDRRSSSRDGRRRTDGKD